MLSEGSFVDLRQISARPLCLATFHVDVNVGNPKDRPRLKVNLQSLRYVRNVGLLFRSINLFHPQSRLCVLTSAETDLTPLRMQYQRLDNDIDVKALMLARSISQQKMVRDNDFSLPIVFADSDILINGNFQNVFDEDFDVALTWRTSAHMPINGGLLILNNQRPNVVRRFFDQFIEVYREKYLDDAGWYGDQLALRDVCGVSYREMRDRRLIEVNGCRLLFLPCDRYNYTPADSYASIVEPIYQSAVLHFKGHRKRLMRPYWEAHLQTLEHNTLLRRARARLVKIALVWKANHELPPEVDGEGE